MWKYHYTIFLMNIERRQAMYHDGSKNVLTVEEARKMLGISRGLMYQAVNNHQVPSIRIGRRVLVLLAPLERMLTATG